ncbi:UrcA family protein [Sphingomonas lenta]|uniref:UrcA family protein n=1 Tax=Sphingomonas lenta TaxID=1141887 RepID=A0A2A2SK58_9SPHN|nr:UrcA family protein [Sphingomonas lenta]PAX09609.1 hypothetical protein CKY28_02380 [Sphingomonas lenta]
MRASLIQALAIAAAVVAPTPALAASDVRTASVSHADLNLASAKGRAALERRVNGAIKRVCGAGQNRDLGSAMRELRCMADARTRARTDIAALERRAGVALAQNAAGMDLAAR